MMEIEAFKKASLTSHLPLGSCDANANNANNNSNSNSCSKRASWEPETGSILDPFHIEDLLDFSNEDIAGPIGEEGVNNNSSLTTTTTTTTATTTATTTTTTNTTTTATTTTPTTATDASVQANLSSSQHEHPSHTALHADEFPIDCDEMPELEWLSTLVDDDTFTIGELPKNTFIGSKGGSYSPLSNNSSKTTTALTNNNSNNNKSSTNKRSYSTLFDIDENVGTTTTTTTTTPKDRFQVGSPISVLESSTATSTRLVNSVPGRPRSKRVRSSSANSSWSNSTSCLINNPGVATSPSGLIPSSLSPTTSSISDKDFVSSEEHSGLYDQDGVDSNTALSAGDHHHHHDELVLKSSTSLVISSSVLAATTVLKNGKPPLQSSTSKAPGVNNVHSTTGGLAAGGGGTTAAATATTTATAITATTTTGSSGEVQPRRCSHCLSQKTPQWRTGPDGPKTLCNACGVRYKSGRLFPEYRPALSPTFLSEVHSNSHRKVLEMRRQKGLAQAGGCQGGTSSMLMINASSSSSSSPGEVVDGGLIYK